MAKAPVKSDESEGMSDESVGYLADAKRGKSRRFVMITKGASVISLVVYKQGSLEGYKKQAKEAGRGTLTYGIVTGQGENISFRLARSEGFDREPVKSLALKTYLKEEADFKCSPTFEVVETLGPLLDPDDPLVARFFALRKEAEKFLAASPDQATTINPQLIEIEKILDGDPSSDVAYGKIGTLERLFRAPAKVGSTPPTASGNVPPPPPPPPATSDREKFTQRLTALLKQATPYVATHGAAIKALAEEARGEAKLNHFAAADKKLLKLAELLKDTSGESDDSSDVPPPPPPPPVDANQLSTQFKALLVRAKQVADANVLQQIKQLAGEIQPLLKQPNNSDVETRLSKLEQLIDGATKSESPKEKVFEIWRRERELVMERISKFQDALRQKPDPRFKTVADSGFNGVTKRLQVGLHVALVNYDDAVGEDRDAARTKALKAASDMEKFLKEDAMVKLIDANPLKFKVNLATDLTKALAQINSALVS